MLQGNKAANKRKSARNRNVNANSANARNKGEAAANKVDDKPDCIGLKNGGRRLPPFCFSVVSYNNCHQHFLTREVGG